MNNVCPFCNSEAIEHSDSKYYCQICSKTLNLCVWWWIDSVCCDSKYNLDYIGFSFGLDNVLYAVYYPQTQELRLINDETTLINDGTILIMPQNKLINKLKTITLLS